MSREAQKGSGAAETPGLKMVFGTDAVAKNPQ